MTIEIKNMTASVRTRLTNIAKTEKRPFDSITREEEFLMQWNNTMKRWDKYSE